DAADQTDLVLPITPDAANHTDLALPISQYAANQTDLALPISQYADDQTDLALPIEPGTGNQTDLIHLTDSCYKVEEIAEPKLVDGLTSASNLVSQAVESADRQCETPALVGSESADDAS